jgi:flavodoxin
MQSGSDGAPKSRSAVVVYDTEFGNTERIGRSLVKGLERAGVDVGCFGAAATNPDSLRCYDLLVIGAPTQKFTASKRMKEFLARLERAEGLEGKLFFAFDTKLPSRFSGSAAKYIQARLEKMGLKPFAERTSAIGRGNEFKLDEGEEKRFEDIGLDLGRNLAGE